jgi:hypothetical protein
MRSCLQQEGKEFRVLVRADALRLGCAAWWWILDEFEFVLWRVIEEWIESI